MKMLKAFVSGAITASNSIDLLENVRAMLIYSGRLREMGLATYTPCLDIMLSLSTGVLPRKSYLKHDLTWLEDCDFVALVDTPATKLSLGVRGEVQKASQLGIPVLKNEDEVRKFLEERGWVLF